MKIVSWNCNGALRKKLKEADSLGADVLVVQECEDPKFYEQEFGNWATSYLWRGHNKNKGIGVFAKNGIVIKELNWQGSYSIHGLELHPEATWETNDLQLFLPFRVADKVNVLAVWTKSVGNDVFGYVGQLWKYIQIHKLELSAPSTVILGDLNSNVRWDKPNCWWSHSAVLRELEALGQQSVYHYLSDETHGNESVPTFHMHRNLQKPYHIDYVFASRDLLDKCLLEIGDSSDWIMVSDHCPLTFQLT